MCLNGPSIPPPPPPPPPPPKPPVRISEAVRSARLGELRAARRRRGLAATFRTGPGGLESAQFGASTGAKTLLGE